jgi:hypothetical protein
MRDALEEQLASRLGALGETVADELPPPVDLELQVQHRRRRAKATRRWAGVSVAAAILVVAGTSVAVVHGTSGHGSIMVESSSTTAAASVAPLDSLQPGTVMLKADGQYVTSLDAAGVRNATMVAVKLPGVITYARATDDHRQIWYLSLKKGKGACGDVVRADIDRGNSSTIVTHAVAFDVSPDGSHLALYGAGDLAHGKCEPVTRTAPGRIVVVDLPSEMASSTTVGSITSMRWSADSSYLASISCSSTACGSIDIFDLPDPPDAPLVARSGAVSTYPAQLVHSASLADGPDGMYAVENTSPYPNQSAPAAAGVRVDRIDPRAAVQTPTLVFQGGERWKVSQVVPTAAATYVVAAPVTTKAKAHVVGRTGLYRIVGGQLVYVRSLDTAGTLTPVTPFATG